MRGLLIGLGLMAALLAPTTPRALDCSNPQDQASMNQCSYLDWQKSDKALNKNYKRARAVLKRIGTGATALRDGQRAWITFRDNACEAEGAPYDGGTIQPLVVNTCLARLTWRRAEDLNQIADLN